MSFSRFRTGRLRYGLGLLAVLLALAGRFTSGSLVVDAHALGDVAALLEATIRCESGPPAPMTPGNRPDRHGSDQGIAFLAAAAAEPSPLLTPVPVLPGPPSSIPARITEAPPARTPLSVPTGAALPRGPPASA